MQTAELLRSSLYYK